MKNKAQIFSMIAVLMSALFILLFSGATHIALDKKVDITKNKVLRIDNFIVDLEYFIDTTIDKVTFNTLNFTIDYMRIIGNYTNYESVFIDCFNKSYFDYAGSPVNCSLVNENISFMEQIKPIISNASEIYDLSINYSWPKVTFRQYDAYLLEINVSELFTIVQPDMRWDVPITRSRIVDFSGVLDPATVGTPYERRIRHMPGEGDLYRVGDLGGNTTLIATFIDNGYYFRDYTGLSFVQLLEGERLINTSAYNELGLNALLPLENASGGSLYKNNQTSMVLYHYISNLTFTDPNQLVRFKNTTGINSSLIFNKYYVLNSLNVSNTSVLLAVKGCCDDTGCDPACG